MREIIVYAIEWQGDEIDKLPAFVKIKAPAHISGERLRDYVSGWLETRYERLADDFIVID